MTKPPQVTVVMSVYNTASFLRESIESILAQTFTDFEFLIIDDCSTDSSREIIRSYSDPRIRLFCNDKNLALIKSLNKGLQLARGDYIARHDSDDISLPLRLEKEVQFLEANKNVGLLGSYFIAINEAGDFLQYFRPPTDSDTLRRKLLVKNSFAHGTVMFRKECIEKVGCFREELKHCEDYDLWLRVSQFFELANLPFYLYKWRLNINSVSLANKHIQDRNVQLTIRLHQERLSLGMDQIQRGEFDAKKWFKSTTDDLRKKAIAVRAYHFQGSCFLLNDHHKKALEYYLKSLKLDKLNPKTWFLIFFALIKIVIPKSLLSFFFHIFSRLQPKVNF